MNNIGKLFLAGVMGLSLVYAQETNSTVVTHGKTVSKDKVLDTLKKTDSNLSRVQSKDLVPLAIGNYPITDMKVDFDGYVSAIMIDTKGKRSLLLPSKSNPDTYVEKGKPISMLDEGTIITKLTKGLHYVMIVVREERLVLGFTTKEQIYMDALKDDVQLAVVLEDIRSGKYGQFSMKMVPIYKRKD